MTKDNPIKQDMSEDEKMLDPVAETQHYLNDHKEDLERLKQYREEAQDKLDRARSDKAMDPEMMTLDAWPNRPQVRTAALDQNHQKALIALGAAYIKIKELTSAKKRKVSPAEMEHVLALMKDAGVGQ